MGEEDYYLELCERPVQFEKANPVNCVFFDEANKQVFAVRSGGATGVVVKGPDDRNPISFRMDDKGEVKCIKFSLENKILAVQRTSKTVDFCNFIPDNSQLEYTQECKGGLFGEERCIPTTVLPALQWPRVKRPSARPFSNLSALKRVGLRMPTF
ncbi:regulator of MON1-CCZ1 [Homo sapiens]|uniref:Regulator of MON1-CCZ1 n=1 Tax=Homo sapiens TaxID=9606 RepID=K7EQ65_HUMAN|nr:regulator of MON1-CCZ1 [Homo sapiens]KAI4045773.1 regulator of MON1-CCZ1 [Homo sapiens]